jgi:NADH dehydrogenase
MHLAAATHTRRAREYERVNLSGTRNLLAAAEREGVRRFVFVSTRAATSQGGAYGRSKLLAEDAVRQARLEQVVVRLPELLTGRVQEGVDRIVDAARRGAPVAVVGAGDDEVCPILLEDAIQPLLSALEREGVEGKTYTLAGECLTVCEFARLCINSFDSSSRIVRVPRTAVAALSPLAAVLPLPFYPDQLARLRTAKPPPSPEAWEDLGFRPRPVDEALGRGVN